MSFLLNFFKPALTKTWLTNNLKMVIVVRTDIPMGKGKIGAQCAHAALECYRMAVDSNNSTMVKSWLQLGQPKIVLRISNESELIELARQAKRVGLIATAIKDAGKTQLQPGTISVLGIGPGPTDVIDKLTSNLRLL